MTYDEKGNPIITNEFRLDFINEVLDDTSKMNFKSYDDPYFWIIDVDGLLSSPIKINDTLKYPSKTEFLSIHLKSKDTTFLRNQLLSRLNNQNLVDYGFKSINKDKLINYNYDNYDLGIEYLVSEDSILKVEELLKADGILYLSTPIFNEKLNLAYLETEHGPTGECIVFEMKNNKWVTKSILSAWIK